MRGYVTILIFFGGIAFGATSLSFLKSPAPERQENRKSEAGRPPDVAGGSQIIAMSPEQIETQAITIVAATSGKLSRHILVPGLITTASDRVARVPVRVIGTVAEMRKQLGSDTQSGEVVAVLDSREVAEAKSDFLTAGVNLDLQQTNYDRAKSLWDKRVSSEAQYLQAQATFSEAQLRLDLARQKLSALGLDARIVSADAEREKVGDTPSSLRKYELRAPISGRIIDRKVDVGAAVGKEGDPSDVYTIADLSVMWSDLSVPAFELDQIKEGNSVLLSISGQEKQKSRKAKVVFISPILSADTRSARVIAEIPNADTAWRPGEFVSAEIETSRDDVQLLVPLSSIQKIDAKPVLFVRTPEGFEKREIRTGRKDDRSIEVISGLKAGEEIAVANTFLLKAELGKSEAADD